MNDANTMSTLLRAPNSRSSLSRSDTAGRSTSARGRLTPLRFVSVCVLSTRHRTVVASTFASMVRSSTPSSMKIFPPTAVTSTKRG
jgi:hypothetical protein